MMRNFLQSLQQFDLAQLRDLDSLGAWPLAVKLTLWLTAFVLALAAGYFLHVAGLRQQLERQTAQETQLRRTYEQQYGLAAHLATYQRQQRRLQASFDTALQPLASEAEMPALLEGIAQAGASNGLTVDSLDLAPESPQGFYAQQPINMVVRGDYHSLGAFVSALAQLPRLLTLHDFTLSADGQGEAPLTLRLEARTYRHKETHHDD